MNSLDFANALYEQSLKSKPQTIEEIIAQKIAIEKEEFKRFKQRIAKRKKELFKVLFEVLLFIFLLNFEFLSSFFLLYV